MANSTVEDQRIDAAHRAATTDWQAIGEETGFDRETLVEFGQRWFPALEREEIECLIPIYET